MKITRLFSDNFALLAKLSSVAVLAIMVNATPALAGDPLSDEQVICASHCYDIQSACTLGCHTNPYPDPITCMDNCLDIYSFCMEVTCGIPL